VLRRWSIRIEQVTGVASAIAQSMRTQDANSQEITSNTFRTAADVRKVTTTVLPIFPAATGYGEMLLGLRACVAFTLLALVGPHIGAAMHDYLISERSETRE
jgi:hypothetical protein